MNKNKQKGKRFEDKIAKILRICWQLSKDECHRAQSSGTFQTDYSDIVIRPMDYEIPHIVIECKYRSSITFNTLLKPSILDDFYKQVIQAGEKYFNEHKHTPLHLIVYSAPNMYPVVAIEESEYKHLVKYPDVYNLQFYSDMLDSVSLFMKVRTRTNKYVQFFVNEFFGSLIGLVPRK